MKNKPNFIASIINETETVKFSSQIKNKDRLHSSPLMFVTFVYLMLPVGLFLAGWFNFTIAVPAIISLFLIIYLLFRTTSWLSIPNLSLFFWIALLISCGWIYISGIGHFVYANGDWLVRDAVLHDLVVQPWPVLYQVDNSNLFILRAPLGYYLPSAVAGKLIGVNAAYKILSVWTGIGVILTFSLIESCFSSLKKRLIAILVFIFFSGLDLVGTLIAHENITIISHLEWWARYFQYSSHTTQLFWVPNHALPGWLGMLLLLAYWRKPSLIGWYPAILCAILLWSPFATIGLLPFYAGYFFVHRRVLIKNWPNLVGVSLLALLFGLPIAYYLTFNLQKVPGELLAGKDGHFWFAYLQFVALEFGILAVLLSRLCNTLPFWIAVIILAILPFIAYGPFNDLAMRASIPALVVIALAAAQVLTNPAHSHVLRGVQIGVSLMVLVGAVTVLHEIARAVIMPQWEPTTSDVVQATHGAPHYVALLDSNSLLAHMLRHDLASSE